MLKLPVTIRDLQVLFTAELSVSRRFACAIAGKLDPDCCDIGFFSASMRLWYDGENAVFFDYSVNGMKYAAILLIRQELPALSGCEQLQLLRKMRKSIRFIDYKELWCMLIIPGEVSSPVEYPVMSWEELETLLNKYSKRSGNYLAQMFKIAANSISEVIADCLTLD